MEAQTKSASTKNSTASSPKKTAPAAAPAKKPSPAPKAKAKAKAKTTAKRPVRRRVPVTADQNRPTKDRYAEIQTALADAGYYSGAADGNWRDESVKALQQFQQDQGLEPTGKIDALTLIRLGLGPDYGESEAGAVASAPSPG